MSEGNRKKYGDSGAAGTARQAALCLAATLIASAVCLYFSLAAAGVCLALGAGLTAAFAITTKRRIDKIAELNNYLSLVCSGKFELDIPDNCEGELSILKNNLYKVIVLLRSQNEQLKKDKLCLADAMADISHQLKTPLTSMIVMTDILQTEQDPAKRQEFLSIIEDQLGRMRWLISNLLKLSKLDAGTVEFRADTVRLADIAKKSLDPFLLICELRRIEIENRVGAESIRGDENWCAEAVGNIVKNCVEHMSDGGRLALSSQSTAIYTSIIIEDDGCGIAPDDLPHIFERFYHGKGADKDSVGIGLALAREIATRHHGEILANSEVGVGSRFEIRFYKTVV